MNKKRIGIISIVMVLGVFSLVILNSKLDNKQTKLDEVKLKENKASNKGFAIMIQKEDKTGYEVYEEATWPTEGYAFNSELSGCIDNNGSIVENSLSYNQETNKVTVNTGVTSSCYVYFDICNPIPIAEYLLATPTLGLDITTTYSGLYRFVGPTANNYIKLGDVLYRIIGITTTTDRNTELGIEANQLKVIKSENIGIHVWHTSYSTDTKWESSAMHLYLQSSNVLGNKEVVPSGWEDKISNVKWNIGDVKNVTNISAIIDLENSTMTSVTSKIGLMYLSDNVYAYTAGGTITCSGTPCVSWITDTNNSTWTMTRYGMYSQGYAAWNVATDGSIIDPDMDATSSVRPTFFLDSNVKRISGSGTISDPFIVSQ